MLGGRCGGATPGAHLGRLAGGLIDYQGQVLNVLGAFVRIAGCARPEVEHARTNGAVISRIFIDIVRGMNSSSAAHGGQNLEDPILTVNGIPTDRLMVCSNNLNLRVRMDAVPRRLSDQVTNCLGVMTAGFGYAGDDHMLRLFPRVASRRPPCGRLPQSPSSKS
jgi:hypothetical protein